MISPEPVIHNFSHKIPVMRINIMYALLALLSMAAMPVITTAQSLDLGIYNTGLSFGNSEYWNGLRFNYRDDQVRNIRGLNATAWFPMQPATGNVTGLAIGLPATGAQNMKGLSFSVAGSATHRHLSGGQVAGLGLAAGSNMTGISVAGLGIGAGNNMTGISIAGLGQVKT